MLPSIVVVSNGTASNATTENPVNGGLSASAQAGIGVSATLGGIIFAGLFWYLWNKRRRQTARSPDKDSNEHMKAELPGESRDIPEADQRGARHEVNGVQKPGELNPNDVRAELLGSRTEAAELEGHWRGWEVPGHVQR